MQPERRSIPVGRSSRKVFLRPPGALVEDGLHPFYSHRSVTLTGSLISARPLASIQLKRFAAHPIEYRSNLNLRGPRAIDPTPVGPADRESIASTIAAACQGSPAADAFESVAFPEYNT